MVSSIESDLSQVLELLAVDTVPRPRNGVEAALLDLFPAVQTFAVGLHFNPVEGRVDAFQDVTFAGGEDITQVAGDRGKGAVTEIRSVLGLPRRLGRASRPDAGEQFGSLCLQQLQRSSGAL